MKNILKTEIKRLLDLINIIENHTSFDAYLDKLKEFEKLKYPELKYYLEQIKNIILGYDNTSFWSDELNAVNKCLDILDQIEIERMAFIRETEPIRYFWNSFKLWTETTLPSLNILKSYYIGYDNWNGGTYYLNVDMPLEFTKTYGLDYDNRFEKECINLQDLKMYIELFYKQFVENRYEYTKEVNKYFAKFSLPYKLAGGKITKKSYKTSISNLKIINYTMLESKMIWAEENILGSEKLDKHTALNYITDSL